MLLLTLDRSARTRRCELVLVREHETKPGANRPRVQEIRRASAARASANLMERGLKARIEIC